MTIYGQSKIFFKFVPFKAFIGILRVLLIGKYFNLNEPCWTKEKEKRKKSIAEHSW